MTPQEIARDVENRLHYRSTSMETAEYEEAVIKHNRRVIADAICAAYERCALIAETLIRPRAGDSVGAATGYEIASKIREGR